MSLLVQPGSDHIKHHAQLYMLIRVRTPTSEVGGRGESPGDTIDTLIAALLCRHNPHSARGDRGGLGRHGDGGLPALHLLFGITGALAGRVELDACQVDLGGASR